MGAVISRYRKPTEPIFSQNGPTQRHVHPNLSLFYWLDLVNYRFHCFSLGNLFHIDFGYILGRDPKPLPPPMKLSKEMVKKTTISYENFTIYHCICPVNKTGTCKTDSIPSNVLVLYERWNAKWILPFSESFCMKWTPVSVMFVNGDDDDGGYDKRIILTCV